MLLLNHCLLVTIYTFFYFFVTKPAFFFCFIYPTKFPGHHFTGGRCQHHHRPDWQSLMTTTLDGGGERDRRRTANEDRFASIRIYSWWFMMWVCCGWVGVGWLCVSEEGKGMSTIFTIAAHQKVRNF